ncbi:MAG: hypothetical protein GY719_23385 [bacterium]|nr:hypothetical protein [bacterium]
MSGVRTVLASVVLLVFFGIAAGVFPAFAEPEEAITQEALDFLTLEELLAAGLELSEIWKLLYETDLIFADGFESGTTCGTWTATISPEFCDGDDDNCNGSIDEGATTTFCADLDDDGYGDPFTAVEACDPPPGYVPDASDCDDTDENVHPDAGDLPDDTFVDTNCDGIDGDAASAVFVATDGAPGAPGTWNEPLSSIQDAIVAASAGALEHVYVSAGAYAEDLILESGISLFGGYSRSGGWSRSDVNEVAVDASSDGVICVEQDNLILDHLTIRGAPATASGASAYAAHFDRCSNVTIRRCVLEAGEGSDGADGQAGAPGSPGADGGDGNPGCDSFNRCSEPPAAGAGGWGCDDHYGGDGGVGGYGEDGFGEDGNPGQGGGGAGGDGGHPTEDGAPGAPGVHGGPGPSGSGGGGFQIQQARYLPADGGDGSQGPDGTSGGGGGGGGGDGGIFMTERYGSSGGGGGGAGCGGDGGMGGSGGGGSFALWLDGCTDMAVTDNHLLAVGGGQGGAGPPGGLGGDGGARGDGGPRVQDQAAAGTGGHGSYGGDGGRGGDGGGGGGGASIGIVLNVCSGCTVADNTFTIGPAGVGGTSAVNNGTDGLDQDVYTPGQQ